jgi:hypothetical protein
MSDDTVPDAPAWIDKPWTATHQETLEDAWNLAYKYGNRPVYEAIDAVLGEIARLEHALDTLALLARSFKLKEVPES